MIIVKEKTEFDILVEKYLEKKNLEKTIKEEVESMKKEIVSSMHGEESITTDYHKVTNKEQIKDGVDLQMLKELFPEAYKKCFKPSIFPVLRAK